MVLVELVLVIVLAEILEILDVSIEKRMNTKKIMEKINSVLEMEYKLGVEGVGEREEPKREPEL